MKQDKLQRAARKKYGKMHTGRAKWDIKLQNITQLFTASELTSTQISLLEHFVSSNTKVLENTIYLPDQIISPVTTQRSVKKLTVRE